MAKFLLIWYTMKKKIGENPKGMFNRVLFAVCIIWILSSSAYPADWCFVASSKNHYYYVDSESISCYRKNITFWIVQQDIESGEPRYKKQFTINCEDETVALRKAERFGVSGSVRDFFSDERYDEWAEIRPHSKMRAVHNIVCCDSRPRGNLREYLQKTMVKKEDFRASSDKSSEKN